MSEITDKYVIKIILESQEAIKQLHQFRKELDTFKNSFNNIKTEIDSVKQMRTDFFNSINDSSISIPVIPEIDTSFIKQFNSEIFKLNDEQVFIKPILDTSFTKDFALNTANEIEKQIQSITLFNNSEYFKQPFITDEVTKPTALFDATMPVFDIEVIRELLKNQEASSQKEAEYALQMVNSFQEISSLSKDIPKEIQIALNSIMAFIQGLNGGGSGIYGLLGNIASTIFSGGIPMPEIAPLPQINRPISQNQNSNQTIIIKGDLNKYAEYKIVKKGNEELRLRQ